MSEQKDWQEVSTDFYRFEKVGDTVQGVLVIKDIQQMRDTEVGRFEVELTEGGKRIAFLGGVALDRLMEHVSVGKQIKLVFQGKVKTTGGTEVKTFQLFHKPA